MMLFASVVDCKLELLGHGHMMHHVPAAFAQRMLLEAAYRSAR